MNWGSFNDWQAGLITLAAGIVAVGTIYRKGIRPVFRGVSEFGRKAHDLNEILDQLRPNGGTSMVDRIGQIETDVTTIDKRLGAIETRLERRP